MGWGECVYKAVEGGGQVKGFSHAEGVGGGGEGKAHTVLRDLNAGPY